MDVDWFKQKQKEARVTADDIARAMGRNRSNVSNIYNGRQKMSLDWARAFAQVLGQPLDEVLRHAGITAPGEARQIQVGFSDGDAVPFRADTPEARREQARAQALGAGPGVDVWTVRSNALLLAGYLPGDQLLVDSHAADRARAGDIVLAQHYDAQTASAQTILRRFEPPVLLSASPDPADQGALVVDGRNVLIRGVVVASWRSGRQAR